MIITRTPLRISLGGGGTNLPSYYTQAGGFVISAAISRYVYISLHRTFQRNYIIKYSSQETVGSLEEIQHPIVREAFRLNAVEPRIEMVSHADIPSGTGLGSSGAFNVGLLRGLKAFTRKVCSTYELAEEACRVEIDILKEPIGKQDQYIAAFGGLMCLEIAKDGKVTVTPLAIDPDAINLLEDNLLMFFTGYSRSASQVLGEQHAKTQEKNKDMIDNLQFTHQLGYQIKYALEKGDTTEFGRLMHQHWLRKKDRSLGITNSFINEAYDLGRRNGAIGGKLVGAGGGGFLLFYAEDRARLRKAMQTAGLEEVRFSFEFEGSKVLVHG